MSSRIFPRDQTALSSDPVQAQAKFERTTTWWSLESLSGWVRTIHSCDPRPWEAACGCDPWNMPGGAGSCPAITIGSGRPTCVKLDKVEIASMGH